MIRKWRKNYPVGVSTNIEPIKQKSMLEVFHQTVDRYQQKVAYVEGNKTLSFYELEELSRYFAAYLQNDLNIKKGMRVALMCPNILSFLVAMWGVIRVGAVLVNVNPLYTARELKHQLNDAEVETMIIFDSALPVLDQIIDDTGLKHVIKIDNVDIKQCLQQNQIKTNKEQQTQDSKVRLENINLYPQVINFSDALNLGKNSSLKEPVSDLDDLMFLQYTGGTTGLSKGAMLSHGNVLANLYQYEAFCRHLIRYGEEVVITAIPMYHIFALTVNVLCYFSFGASNHLIANPRDMKRFVNTWSKIKVTFFTGVNTLFNGLLHTAGFNQLDFSALKLVIGGGAPVQDSVSDKWKKVTGKRINEGYGLSETSPILTLNIEKCGQYISGIGVPLPSTDIVILDKNEQPVSDCQTGELCAKGPQVMSGYWRDKDATSQVMTKGGYFKTGDLALLDDLGYFHIVDRKKDMILVSGFNVYPNEIEAQVAQIDGVLESACVGVEDSKTGEAIKLFVVKLNPELTKLDIEKYCRSQLAAYKVPKTIEFIDSIPKSSVGKILRRELR